AWYWWGRHSCLPVGQTFLSAGGADILVCWWGRHSCLLVGQTFLSAGGADILVCHQFDLNGLGGTRMSLARPFNGRQECLPHQIGVSLIHPFNGGHKCLPQ